MSKLSSKQLDGLSADRLPLQPHPIAAAFPRLSPDKLKELASDIKANGLIAPITTLDGMILEGVNRDDACRIAGIAPRYEPYRGDDPIGFALSRNLHRRHLTVWQRAMVAAALANMRQGTRTDLEHRAKLPEVSLDDAARKVGVSRRSVVTAKKVQKDGDPALVEAVKRGDISVAGAERLAIKPEDEQREIVAGGKRAIKQAVKTARKAKSILGPTSSAFS
jgi:hypothetical protein